MKRRKYLVLGGWLVVVTTVPDVAAADEIVYEFDGAVVFQGQPVTASGTAIEPNSIYELYIVESYDTGDVNTASFIQEEQADTDGEVTIETNELDAGDYYLRGEGLPTSPDQTDTFELTLQEISTAFSQESIEVGLGTNFSIDSNRGTYTVDINSSRFTTDELKSIFTEDGNFGLADEQPATEGVIRLEEESDQTAPVVFAGETIATGEYLFNIDVIDTAADDTASITLVEKDRNVELALTPTDPTIDVGEEVELFIRLRGASSGLGNYNFDLLLDNTETITNIDFEVVSDAVDESAVSVDISDDLVSVSVEETTFSRLQEDEIARLTATGEQRDTLGQVSVSIENSTVEDENDEGYTIENTSGSTITVEPSGRGQTSLDGIVWQGQTGIEDGDQIDPDGNYALRSVNTFVDGTVSDSSFVVELEVVADKHLEIETANFDAGDYFIRGDGFPTNPDIEDTFEIVIQDLDGTFIPGTATDEEQTTVELDSSRASYDVVVSAGGDLSEDKLMSIFAENGEFELIDSFFGNEEAIEIHVPDRDVKKISFAGISADDYDFTFSVADTTATATASITVEETVSPLFDVEIIDPEDGSEVNEDNELTVTANISNTGNEEGTQSLTLISPEEKTSDELTLEPDGTESVEYTISKELLDGDVSITVESEDTSDSITVTAVDPCFIATAAYGTPTVNEIDILRDFRDDVLQRNALGRLFIKTYYWGSPPVARWIRRNDTRRKLVKQYFVGPLVNIVQTSSNKWKRE